MISAKKLIKVLKKKWFELKRVKWSHYNFSNWKDDITIPFHNSKDIWRWLLRTILKQSSISHKEFLDIIWINN